MPESGYAGISAAALAVAPDVLQVMLIADPDVANDAGLTTSQPPPPRRLQGFELRGGAWTDLGTPRAITGWYSGVSLGAGADPLVLTGEGVSTVELAQTVQRCGDQRWDQLVVELGARDSIVAPLVLGSGPAALVLRAGEMDVHACDKSPLTGFAPPVIRLARLGAAGAIGPEAALFPASACRNAKRLAVAHDGAGVAVAYESCAVSWGGDYIATGDCRIDVLWLADGRWHRLPPVADLGGYDFHDRHAIAIGPRGPELAALHPKQVVLHRWDGQRWNAATARPGHCEQVLAVASNPSRVVMSGCGKALTIDAVIERDGAWHPAAPTLDVRAPYVRQTHPRRFAGWVGDDPVVLVAYEGAPVARLHQGSATGWELLGELIVDPVAP